MAASPVLYTIGHSRHPVERLIELLRANGVAGLYDVRSRPASRFAPQFNRRAVALSLNEAGIAYVFAGEGLGGRPAGAEFYDADGHVRYDLLAASPRFRSGLGSLKSAMREGTVAVMCAEEDPSSCHRRLLIARALEDYAEVRHVRGDGRVQVEGDEVRQGRLLDDAVGPLRSLKPIRRPRPTVD